MSHHRPRKHRLLALGLALALSATPRAWTAAAWATAADDLCAASADPCVVATVIAVDDGSVLDFGTRALTVARGGRLDVGSGTVAVIAGTLTIESGGEIRARGGGTEPGGAVQVVANTISVGGTINVSGESGGGVTLTATGPLSIAGTVMAEATTSEGSGGSIGLTAASVVVDGDLLAAGGVESSGGSVRVHTAADATIDGRIEVEGGDGGDMNLAAGASGGGNLELGPNARLFAGARGDAGSGGSIDLSADGDGRMTGHVIVEALMNAGGATGGEPGEEVGGDGGLIGVRAAGDVRGHTRGAIEANGAPPDGFGGEIVLSAAATFYTGQRIVARGEGSEGSGGAIEFEAGDGLTIRGTVSVGGAGDGGSIRAVASRGDLEVAEGATLDSSGSLGGSGGTIECTSEGEAAAMRIAGAVVGNGGAPGVDTGPGDGAAVTLMADGPLAVTGTVRVLGGTGGGNGGTILLASARGPLEVDGLVAASGRGGRSEGGSVGLTSGGRIAVRGTIDAVAAAGGSIVADAAGLTTLAGRLLATGAAVGGSVAVVVENALLVEGEIRVDAASGAADGIDLDACTLRVGSAGTLATAGSNGRNRVVGRGPLTIAGSLQADPATGRNELVVSAFEALLILSGASVVPAETVVVDASLGGCTICGDGTIDPGETCDDGGQCVGGDDDGRSCTSDLQCPGGVCRPVRGDGCSEDCQIEVLLGDVDGDGTVNAMDLQGLVFELFDGDGDAVAFAGSGTYAATPGADANVDDRVTAADLSAIVLRLAGGDFSLASPVGLR
jgi:hypothetical protein